MVVELLQEARKYQEIPFVSFPENPRVIIVGGIQVYDYISPATFETYLDKLSFLIPLSEYENILVNLDGGAFLFQVLSIFQGYKKPPIFIEYHRPDGGFGARIVRKVPDFVKGQKNLVVEDVADSGGVLQAIGRDSGENTQNVVSVIKSVDGQLPLPNLVGGVKVENLWLGGAGMDIGIPGEGMAFRNYPGIVVKISSDSTPSKI